ncbi:hypothetical protein GGI05_001648, partial [Coemansia sp. RSA 2603]
HVADGASGGRPGHHRRTSSGLVGFLMRGFRSSSGSLSPHAESCAPPASSSLSPRPPVQHARSASSGCEYLHVPPAARLVRRRDQRDQRDQHYDAESSASAQSYTADSRGSSSEGSRIVMRPLTGHAHHRGFYSHDGAPATAPAAASHADVSSSQPLRTRLAPGPVLRRRHHHHHQ